MSAPTPGVKRGKTTGKGTRNSSGPVRRCVYCDRGALPDGRYTACQSCRVLRDQGCDQCGGRVNAKGVVFRETGPTSAILSEDGQFLGNARPTGPPAVYCEACLYTAPEIRQRQVYGCLTMELLQHEAEMRARDLATGSELAARRWAKRDAARSTRSRPNLRPV